MSYVAAGLSCIGWAAWLGSVVCWIVTALCFHKCCVGELDTEQKHECMLVPLESIAFDKYHTSTPLLYHHSISIRFKWSLNFRNG